ncbi:Uma2 family endonuclease [Pseudonocardiaceae bacterium YIM PH 21723]|nr:Uma2 family endonuclease [Pseudonocardiaceae bacterium YIM PH 21723]
MTVMAAEVGSTSRPLTVRDLEGMPDDGRRYELIDGELFVTPAPGTYHQTVAAKMIVVLDNVCPANLHVLPAPYAFQMDMRNEVQPDVLVARIEDLTAKRLIAPPVLAVEILSPGTGFRDLHRKKDFYQWVGVPSYWVIDPVEPRLLAFELGASGRYGECAEVGPDEEFRTTRPYPVRFTPGELLGKLRNLRLED